MMGGAKMGPQMYQQKRTCGLRTWGLGQFFKNLVPKRQVLKKKWLTFPYPSEDIVQNAISRKLTTASGKFRKMDTVLEDFDQGRCFDAEKNSWVSSTGESTSLRLLKQIEETTRNTRRRKQFCFKLLNHCFLKGLKLWWKFNQ